MNTEQNHPTAEAVQADVDLVGRFISDRPSCDAPAAINALHRINAEVRRLTAERDALKAGNEQLRAGLHAQEAELTALRARLEQAEGERDAARALWTEMRVVLAQSRDANCLCSYGATQVDAVEAANAILNRMPADYQTDLAKEKARADAAEALVERLQKEQQQVWNEIYDATCGRTDDTDLITAVKYLIERRDAACAKSDALEQRNARLVEALGLVWDMAYNTASLLTNIQEFRDECASIALLANDALDGKAFALTMHAQAAALTEGVAEPTAQPAASDPLQALADQAQELGMGYGAATETTSTKLARELRDEAQKMTPEEKAQAHETAMRIINATEQGAEDGVALIAAERARQISQEGWTHEHDDEHAEGALARAAAVYAMPPECREERAKFVEGVRGCPVVVSRTLRDFLWLWGEEWFKPSRSRIRELVKAGALIAAEIDRLKRAQPRTTEGSAGEGKQ
jgi:hypothetical protein